MTLREIKINMNRKIKYKGNEYKLVGCMFRQNEKTGEFFYQAELLDEQCERSIAICKLEDVQEINQSF